eukprot:COSAG06_NODE_3704_length_4995_cov_2.891136_3_plen_110_part_00
MHVYHSDQLLPSPWLARACYILILQRTLLRTLLQVRTMGSTVLLVGDHGAGLSNGCVFMAPKRGSVVEVRCSNTPAMGHISPRPCMLFERTAGCSALSSIYALCRYSPN